MNACPEYEKELAACAGSQSPVPAFLARHIEQCPACRSAFAELDRAALLQKQMAAHLPLPHAPARIDLSFLQRKTASPGYPRDFAKPLFVSAAVAIVAVLITFTVHLRSQRGGPSQVTPEITPPSSGTDAAIFPNLTWQALRQEIQSDRAALAVATRPTPVFNSHLRLKDAYTGEH